MTSEMDEIQRLRAEVRAIQTQVRPLAEKFWNAGNWESREGKDRRAICVLLNDANDGLRDALHYMACALGEDPAEDEDEEELEA